MFGLYVKGTGSTLHFRRVLSRGLMRGGGMGWGAHFCLFLFIVHLVPSEKMFCSNLGQGSKFFPFRADSFSEGKKNNFESVTSPEIV